jgi:putative hydrolase of the HAD superfamily
MIRYILFDLDNTLYPSSLGLEEEMGARIQEFTARFLGVSPEEAVQFRRERIVRYGTTLEWLMNEEGFTDIEGYYAAVHPEGEEDRLAPDPATRAFIKALPVPSAILTNSPMEHALRVLKKLDLEDLFTHIFDIRWNGLKGKPQETAFRKALDTIGREPAEVLFVDDFPLYVEGFLRLGGRGVLLDEENLHPAYPGRRIRALGELPGHLED